MSEWTHGKRGDNRSNDTHSNAREDKGFNTKIMLLISNKWTIILDFSLSISEIAQTQSGKRVK